MSLPRKKLQVEYNWGPRCWFFDEAMAAHNFNGTEHAIMYVVQRLTYSEPDYARPGRRKEGAVIPLKEFQRRTGRALSAIHKAILRLEQANVLIVITRGLGRGKASEYGINARIDEWKIPRIGTVDEEKYPGKIYLKKGTSNEVNTGGSVLPQMRYNSDSFEVILGANRGNFTASEPLWDNGSLAAKEILRERVNTPLPPNGGGDGFPPAGVTEDLITTFDAAILRQDIPATIAVSHAERNYANIFGQSLSPEERSDLREFFDLSRFRGSLLGLWIQALPTAFAERQEMRSDPERKRYARGSPYKATRRIAGDLYAELKAKQTQGEKT